MALSDMKVFNQYVSEAAIEELAQMVDKFNAASRGAIRLTTEGFDGDYLQKSMFASLHAAQRRVDRYNTNGTPSVTSVSQLQHNTVKVAGGFGPIKWEPAQLTYIRMNPQSALQLISRNMAEAMMKDMLNTAIAALVAAIEAGTTNTVADAGTADISYNGINNAHAKFGDSSNLIVANVMDGIAYHALIGSNLTNTAQLFQAQGVTVVDILGRAVVVTDAPALRETGTGADYKVLGLVQDAAIVHNAGDVVSNLETTNGKHRIETTFQADYTFGLGLKGFAWDTSTGGKTPTDAELATGGNWDKIATSWKHTAGVLALFDV